MKIVDKKTFINSDLERNANKYWIIERFDNNSVKTSYGRVGDSGQSTTKTFSSTSEAEKFFNSKVKEKSKVKSRRDAYTEIHILDNITVAKSPSRHISDIAAEQIETDSDNVRSLIRWFSDRNIHNIVSNTNVSYNIVEGCFRTPLGVVDSVCINNAKVLLEEISQFPDKLDKECIKKVNQYLRYIPQQTARKLNVEDIFGSSDLLQKQADILDGLEAAIIQSKPTTSTTERIFNTKLDICKDESKISELKTRFDRDCRNSRINAIYEVSIKDVSDRFLNYSRSIGNKQQLWHATSPRNILSIFQSGLIIPKSYSNGWNHGAGVYFSDRSSKSMQYLSMDYRDSKKYGYMFVGEVALGNITYDNGKSILNGGESRWAYKGQSESQIIVYNTGQINLLYLLEII